MLLQSQLRGHGVLIRVGCGCLAVGILLSRLAPHLPDFWAGFLAGLSAVLFGVSIVLNIRGLRLRREEAALHTSRQ